MTIATYDNIFSLYYRLYRAEAVVPSSTDDEYTIGLSLANEAIARWANYDGTYWKDLFSTLQTDGGGDQTVVTSQTSYAAPGNFREAGGFVKIKNSTGQTVQTYPILDPSEAQFRTDTASYCYFTTGKLYYSTGTVSQAAGTVTGVGTTFTSVMVGMQIQYASGEVGTITAFGSTTSLTVSPSQTVLSTTFKIVNTGYTLNLNPAPTSTVNGMDLDYVYYKKPSELTTGSSTTECPDTEYIVHRMLANRFRASRNPYYASAKSDAEDALRTMQIDNNSGTWSNPWALPDNSGASWGSQNSSRSYF